MKRIAVVASIIAAVSTSAVSQSLRPAEGSRGGQVAPQSTSDPLKVLYRIMGVRDSGGYEQGTATVFHCTNFSNAMELISVKAYNYLGQLVANSTISAPSRWPKTIATHLTAAYNEDHVLSASGMTQGYVVISSTTTNLHCTAMTIDAASPVPVGVALHMIRFNPQPGSVE